VVFPAIILSSIGGISIGLITGYLGGIIDLLAVRIFDVLLAFPSLLLALILVAIFGPTSIVLIAALALPSFPQFVLLTRSTSIATKQCEYIQAAQASGASLVRIMWRHLLPNITTPLVIQVALSFSTALLVEASLSFLGLGVQPPMPSWGGMLSRGYSYMTIAPWIVLAPGTALMMAILGFNLLGDGLRDMLAPGRKG
jgi:ABC-type dipeptide/oligopeptide/nickel transport system permease subunit